MLLFGEAEFLNVDYCHRMEFIYSYTNEDICNPLTSTFLQNDTSSLIIMT